MQCALVALVAGLGMTIVVPGPALAHGHLRSSTPGSGAHLAQVPRQLRLDFSETPELAFSSMRLLAADGREIPLGALEYAPDSKRSLVASVKGAMEAGIYVVRWQMAGGDGHPVRGRFDFVIAPGAVGLGVTPAGATPVPGEDAVARPPSGMPVMHHDPVTMPEGNGFGVDSPLYVLVRWMEFMALLLLVGTIAFHSFVLGRLRRVARTGGEAAAPAMLSAAERSAASIGLAAAVMLAASIVLRLVAQSFAMHGAEHAWSPALVGQMIRRTTWGWGWMLQSLGAMLSVAGLNGARGGEGGASPGAARDRALWWRLAAMGAVVAAFAPAF
jgi:methionine-rich copper-binding protein CopC